MTKLQSLRKHLSTHLPLVHWDYDGYTSLVEILETCDTQRDWNQTLITKINQIGAAIFQDTKCGGANTILIPTGIMEDLLMSLEYTQVNRVGYEEYYKLGVLAGRYQIYVIPNLTKTKIEVNNGEYVDVDENKIYVCKLKDNNYGIFDVKNYVKIGVIKIDKRMSIKDFPTLNTD